MAQPIPYERSYSFTNWSSSHPSDPHPGVQLDAQFDALEVTTDQIRTNLALIQRDDGLLANGSVGADQLSTEITIGLRSIGPWATSTAYVVNDAVWYGSMLYRCLVAHTSGTFSTDLAADSWGDIVDFATIAEAAVAAALVGEIEIDEETFAEIFAELRAADDINAANIATANDAIGSLDTRVTTVENNIPADPTETIADNKAFATALAVVFN